MSLARAAYPSDVSDEEWALVAPYLALLRESSGQHGHELREVFNGLRYIVKTGAPWRFMPHDLPPWAAVYQQVQRWLAADCFAEVAGDLRAVLRMADAREPEPSAVVLDSRSVRSSPKSGRAPMGPSASAAPRCIWRWTRLALWWRSPSRPPTPTTATRWIGERVRCRRRRTAPWRRRLSIRATARGRPRRLLARTGLSWRWSGRPRPSAASCCCRGAGLWKDPSPGPHAAAAS